jgi:hypothetical protein
MELGPDMKRLREMDFGGTVKACVTVGPADSMIWEVTACVEVEGMPLESHWTRF